MKNPRPNKPTAHVIKTPPNLVFTESLYTRNSVYLQMLQECLTTGSSIQILVSDKYLMTQFKQAAKKGSLKLLYAGQDQHIYIRPVTNTEAERSLLLLLRSPRTMNDLRGAGLKLDLATTLNSFLNSGLVATKDKLTWAITEKGMQVIK